MSHSSYLVKIRRCPNPRGYLVCMHHAGGSAQAYRAWADDLDLCVDIDAVELPGRGSRFGEPVPDALADVAEAICQEIRAAAPANRAIVLFGHSLGSYLVYEVALRLSRLGLRPAHVIVSGSSAPHLKDEEDDDPLMHTLDNDALVEKLRTLGGTPPAVLAHPELMELVLPVIRADLKLAETYNADQMVPLDCPLTAAGGTDDEDLTEVKLRGWEQYTTASFTMQFFDGDHFYLETHRRALLDWLGRHLEKTGSLTRPTASKATPG